MGGNVVFLSRKKGDILSKNPRGTIPIRGTNVRKRGVGQRLVSICETLTIKQSYGCGVLLVGMGEPGSLSRKKKECDLPTL